MEIGESTGNRRKTRRSSKREKIELKNRERSIEGENRGHVGVGETGLVSSRPVEEMRDGERGDEYVGEAMSLEQICNEEREEAMSLEQICNEERK